MADAPYLHALFCRYMIRFSPLWSDAFIFASCCEYLDGSRFEVQESPRGIFILAVKFIFFRTFITIRDFLCKEARCCYRRYHDCYKHRKGKTKKNHLYFGAMRIDMCLMIPSGATRHWFIKSPWPVPQSWRNWLDGSFKPTRHMHN
jgi:hypothetical protein